MPSELLEALVARLDAIHKRILDLLEEVELTERKINPESSTAEIVADPNPVQQKELLGLAEALRRWRAIAEVFLEKSAPETVVPLRSEAMLLMSYVLMERSGRDIEYHVWKQLFTRESTLVVAKITAILRDHADAFQPQPPLDYSDIEVAVRRQGDGWALECRGELGSARAENLPLDHFPVALPEDIEDVLALSESGHQIFSRLFTDEVGRLFERCRERAAAQDRGMRVRLLLGQADSVQNIPWETMFDGRDFVSLSFDSPVTRQLDSIPTAPPRQVEHPLRILVTVSQPTDLGKLDVDRERQLLEQAVAPLVSLGVIRLDFTPDGTLAAVERALRGALAGGNPHHAWHFIGHGLDRAGNQLIFEGPNRSQCPVSGFQLGPLLGNQRSLGLAVLNACHSADDGQGGLLEGVSSSLLDRGVSAVVAMQRAISDDAAIAFCQSFYEGLVDGLPVDAATTAGRRAIFFSGNHHEWSTPVTFMRSSAGNVFDWRNKAWEVALDASG